MENKLIKTILAVTNIAVGAIILYFFLFTNSFAVLAGLIVGIIVVFAGFLQPSSVPSLGEHLISSFVIIFLWLYLYFSAFLFWRGVSFLRNSLWDVKKNFMAGIGLLLSCLGFIITSLIQDALPSRVSTEGVFTGTEGCIHILAMVYSSVLIYCNFRLKNENSRCRVIF